MPRVRRRAKLRRSGYTEEHVFQLLEGHDFYGTAFGIGLDLDEAAAKAAWELLREKLLPAWIKERPGTRPWAWWKFEAPERRRRIDGKPHPFDDKARTLYVAKSENETLWRRAYGLYFGLPAAHIMPFDKDVKLETFEGEWELLVRHNLLLPEDSP